MLTRHATCVLLLYGLGGCAEGTTAGQGEERTPSTPRYVSSAVSSRMTLSFAGEQVSETKAFDLMATLTRGIAMALSDDSARKAFFTALTASPFSERKLHFRTFTLGGGAALLRAAAKRLGREEESIDAIRDSTIDLELYMPVPAHRAGYDGGRNLIVATSFDVDDDIPIAFDLNGNRVNLTSAKVAPSTPTLALVRRETDFTSVPQTIIDDSTPPPRPRPRLQASMSSFRFSPTTTRVS